ncbi:MAG: phosphoribosylamine--glycine ligase [Parvularculaceae bacterium]|nr:phosphoribosylamine--glycine ligase [Parvularculaceae bacterium]
MKVLLVGGGGREHALGWKIAQSPLLTKLFVAPGNPGIKPLGERLALGAEDVDAIVSAARARAVDLVVVGPEAPLALGLADRLRAHGVPCFGPSQAAARLESSKAFMKETATRAGAPTAAFGRFKDVAAAQAFLAGMSAPYVVKADGLAAGKGVVIAETFAEADSAVRDLLGGRFGEAGAEIVIEEFMAGEEASYFVLTDGETILPLAAAQDHKRAFDGDKGPNTGGMGAYSPAPVFSTEVEEETLARIIRPVLAEMRRGGTPFQGVLFAGLMIGESGPRLVEFNARFGDPECQVLMRRLEGDLLPALHAAATGRLHEVTLQWSRNAAAVIVLAADGYPGAYRKGGEIKGVARADALPGVVVFQAGTEEKDGRLFASGGRVLSVSAVGATLPEAVRRAYAGVDAIEWRDGFCRRDIGWRAMKTFI